MPQQTAAGSNEGESALELQENQLHAGSSANEQGSSAGGFASATRTLTRQSTSTGGQVVEGCSMAFSDKHVGDVIGLSYSGEFPIGVIHSGEMFTVDWDETSSKEWDWSVKRKPQNPRSKIIENEREWTILRIGHGFRGIVTLSRLDEETGTEVFCKFENPCFMQPAAIPGLTFILCTGFHMLPCLSTEITHSTSPTRLANRTFSFVTSTFIICTGCAFALQQLGLEVVGIHDPHTQNSTDNTTVFAMRPENTISYGDDWVTRTCVFFLMCTISLGELIWTIDADKTWFSRRGQATVARCLHVQLKTEDAWQQFTTEWGRYIFCLSAPSFVLVLLMMMYISSQAGWHWALNFVTVPIACSAFMQAFAVVVTCRILCEGPLSHIAGLEAELLLACDGVTPEERQVDFREEKYLELMEEVAKTMMQECKYLVEPILMYLATFSFFCFIAGLLIFTRPNGAVAVGVLWFVAGIFFFAQSIRLQALVGNRYGVLLSHCNRFSFVQENSWWLAHFEQSTLHCALTWVLMASPISQNTLVTCTVSTLVGVMFVVLPPFFVA